MVVMAVRQHDDVAQAGALVQRPAAVARERHALDERAEARDADVGARGRAAAARVDEDERAGGWDAVRVEEGPLGVEVVRLGEEEGVCGEAAGAEGARVRFVRGFWAVWGRWCRGVGVVRCR